MSLTIFYDGHCPLCCAELNKIKQRDVRHQITLVDIQDQNLMSKYPEIKREAAMAVLHGYLNNRLLLGLDVTIAAWQLVGKGFWVAPLQWPMVNRVAHGAYRFFAKHRRVISNIAFRYLGVGSNICQNGKCDVNANNTYRRR